MIRFRDLPTHDQAWLLDEMRLRAMLLDADFHDARADLDERKQTQEDAALLHRGNRR